jgi:hypothetical protein
MLDYIVGILEHYFVIHQCIVFAISFEDRCFIHFGNMRILFLFI